ncbi:hypothetical protein CW663_09785 [Macrococcoides caseolyticum]|nr:hypothetical protein CW663_09785 [Macrococcus caseolyticus]
MNNKLSGFIIIGLSIVLCIGYFISHSKINNVEKENEILSKLQLQVSHPDKSSSYRILGIHSVCSP